MAESSSDFRDTLLELIETSPQPMDHPSADQWLAYQRGELSAPEEARLQEHLARCRDCFDLAEGAAAFAEPAAEPGAGLEVETAALWRLLRPRLDLPPQDLHNAPDNVRPISAGPRRPSSKFQLPTLLAASFFVALVGLTVWNLRLRSALAPQPNAPIFDLSAGERGPTPASAERTLSAETRTLVVHPPGGLPLYRLALHDAAAGRELWSFPMKPDEDFALTIALPEGLRPGHYRLELSDGAGKRVLETYRLHVTEAVRGE